MRRLGGLIAVVILAADVSSRAGAHRFEYARDVAPLLARSCVSCHSGEHPKAGLHLDRPAGVATVVRPGAARDSEIMRRLLGEGGDDRMPAGGPALASREIALVRRWIDEGAPGLPAPAGAGAAPPHWAYQRPRRPPLPATRDARWPRNAIDHFVLARLEQGGLRPAPEADRETLIRRVTLDLTGLPPTPEEIDAFLADARGASDGGSSAYEAVVDRLLASRPYGERWAVPWLDAARYADSNGYEKDAARAIWRYRDWVVDAINGDMPFDRFTLEQIAGDLLPDAGETQKIATGFHRNTLLNEEGGVDSDEARFERLCDRATTTSTVWLGSTLGCARCHDHKHDPFTQRDFYAMVAFFEDAREETLRLPTAAEAARLLALRAEAAPLDRLLDTWTPALGEAQRRWEGELLVLPARFHPLSDLTLSSTASPPLVPQSDGSIFVAAPTGGEATHTVTGDSELARITGVRVEALPDARLPGGGPGRGVNGGFFLTGVELAAASVREPVPRWAPIRLRQVVADDRPREEPERYAAENLLPEPPPAPSLDPEVVRGWGVDASRDGAQRLPRQLVLVPDRPFGFVGGTRVRARMRYGAAAQGEVIGRFRVTVTDVDAPAAVAALEPRLLRAVRTPPTARPVADGNELAAAFRRITPLLAAERAQRAALDDQERALGVASTLVMAPRPAPGAGERAPAETRLRPRGTFASTGGDLVNAALPAVLVPDGAAAPHDRLALARWLASDANPLVARATVNRIWAQYFGRGLLEASEDFGHSGGLPSHPELLDWLAVELASSGWRSKPLHRLIVTSATYRQASTLPEAARRLVAERDPDNRLLARGPRRRLEAEMVRDLALAASGLLDRRPGGPPVFPPQPAGVWAPPNSREDPWPTSRGADRYRRALYVFWRRTAPYPTAALFDAPTREVCTVRRNRTSTPLQALATLNDPVFWEAAQALARRMTEEARAGAPVEERIALGFRLCVGRTPGRADLAPLLALFARQRARDGDDAAALTLVANVLLNLDETLTNH